jgi:predicted nucleic acid-binding Zn ribbon protein
MMIPDGKGQMKEQIDFSKTTEIKCEACGGQTFKQTLLMRKMSALVSPNGQEAIVPVMAFACDSCGHINEEFLNAPITGQ